MPGFFDTAADVAREHVEYWQSFDWTPAEALEALGVRAPPGHPVRWFHVENAVRREWIALHYQDKESNMAGKHYGRKLTGGGLKTVTVRDPERAAEARAAGEVEVAAHIERHGVTICAPAYGFGGEPQPNIGGGPGAAAQNTRTPRVAEVA